MFAPLTCLLLYHMILFIVAIYGNTWLGMSLFLLKSLLIIFIHLNFIMIFRTILQTMPFFKIYVHFD